MTETSIVPKTQHYVFLTDVISVRVVTRSKMVNLTKYNIGEEFFKLNIYQLTAN